MGSRYGFYDVHGYGFKYIHYDFTYVSKHLYGRFTKIFILVVVDGLEIAHTQALAIFPKFYM